MTGHREPPVEWIPLTAAILCIPAVRDAFEDGLAWDQELHEYGDLEVIRGETVLWPAYNESLHYRVGGIDVFVHNGPAYAMPNPNTDIAGFRVVTKRVEFAAYQAAQKVMQLVSDRTFRIYGRHGSPRADHLVIPADIVRGGAITLDIGACTATYNDGSTAEFVHIERTNKPTLAQAVAGLSQYLENTDAPCPEPVEPRECDTGNEADEEGFKAWLSAVYDASPEKRTKTIKQIKEYALTNFKVQDSRAEELRASIFALRGLEFRNAWSKGGRPRGFEK